MNLQNLLDELHEISGKTMFLIYEVEAELRKQKAAAAPVKAFENHWKSMGKSVDEQKATSTLPMEYTVWGLTLDADAFMSALKKNGWKDIPQLMKTGRWSSNSVSFPPKAVEPVPQADGHVDPSMDEVLYEAYGRSVRNCGPYYPFETWKTMGRPRG